MSISDYKDSIEKIASIGALKSKALELAQKAINPKLVGGVAAGAGALGTGYALSDKEDRKEIKRNAKLLGHAAFSGATSDQAQDMIANAGAIAGLGLGYLKGKNMSSTSKRIRKAVKSGIAGMAIGDIGAAATVPTLNFKREYKNKYGHNPSAKEYATTVGANLAPTAALYAGLYGLSKGKKVRRNMEDKAVKILHETKPALAKEIGSFKNTYRNLNDIPENMRYKAVNNHVKKFGRMGVETGKDLLSAFAGFELAGKAAGLPGMIAQPSLQMEVKDRREKRRK